MLVNYILESTLSARRINEVEQIAPVILCGCLLVVFLFVSQYVHKLRAEFDSHVLYGPIFTGFWERIST